MSAQSVITGYLRDIAHKDGTFLPFSAKDVSEKLAIDVGKVHSTVYNLTSRGFAEVERDGRNITGIRFTDKEPGSRSPSRPKAEGQTFATRTFVQTIRTPELDLYMQAKKEAAALSEKYSSYVNVTFEEDALAEEAIKLQRTAAEQGMAITDLREQLRAAKNELAMVRSEAEALRSKRNAKMVAEASEAGALAVHSS